jgi:putative transposase
MQRAFVYRLYPTRAQEQRLEATLETCRRFYNDLLAERKNAWEQAGLTIGKVTQLRHVRERQAENPHAAAMHCHVLQVVVTDLDRAFQAFFRRVKAGEPPGYPRFRGRGRFDSFGFKELGNGFKIDGKRLKLSKIGRVRVRWHRPIAGEVRTVRVTRRADGWYACFACDVEPQPFPPAGESVGIDVGIEVLATLSTGERIDNPRHLSRALKRLRVAQRRLARRTKGSRRRAKARVLVAKAHLAVRRQRLDYAHKVALNLTRRFDQIAVERLNIRGMVRNHPLARAISDAGWGIFLSVLRGKAEWAGRAVVEVNPSGTSQECADCAEKVPKRLSQRWHSCPWCGSQRHRDHNAAINILNRGGQLRSALSIPLGVLAGEAAGF